MTQTSTLPRHLASGRMSLLDWCLRRFAALKKGPTRLEKLRHTVNLDAALTEKHAMLSRLGQVSACDESRNWRGTSGRPSFYE